MHGKIMFSFEQKYTYVLLVRIISSWLIYTCPGSFDIWMTYPVRQIYEMLLWSIFTIFLFTFSSHMAIWFILVNHC